MLLCLALTVSKGVVVILLTFPDQTERPEEALNLYLLGNIFSLNLWACDCFVDIFICNSNSGVEDNNTYISYLDKMSG